MSPSISLYHPSQRHHGSRGWEQHSRAPAPHAHRSPSSTQPGGFPSHSTEKAPTAFFPPCQRRGSTPAPAAPNRNRSRSTLPGAGSSPKQPLLLREGAAHHLVAAPRGNQNLHHQTGASSNISKSKLSFDNSGLSFLASHKWFSGTSLPPSTRPLVYKLGKNCRISHF